MAFVSFHHRAALIAFTLALTAGLSASVDPELLKRFQENWADRESETRTEENRIRLAKDLYTAARDDESRPMKILLLYKSYDWGRRDFPRGYYHASRALQLIQRIDPKERTPCLEKLAQLFNHAWQQGRRTRLGDGAGYAEVQYQIAQQRLLDLLQTHRTQSGGVARERFLAELYRVRRHAAVGVSAARAVLASAQAALRRPDITSRGRRVFGEFVTENGALLALLGKQQEYATRLAETYKADGDQALPPHQRAGVEVAEAEPPPAEPSTPTPPPGGNDDPPASPVTPPAPPTETKPPAPPVAAITPPRSGGMTWRERKCQECQETFVPRHGSKDHVCYWCRNPLGFFRDGGSK